MKKIKIAISSCLLGHNVRYDGGNKFIDIRKYLDAKIFELQALCPEVAMGMSIPRQPIQMIQDKGLYLQQVQQPHHDYTQQMTQWFEENSEQFKQYSGFILKSKSPSCGHQTTPHFHNKRQVTLADGLFVDLLKQNHKNVAIIDEIDLVNPIKCAEFIQSLQAIQK